MKHFDWVKWSAVAEIVSSIAIVATLICLLDAQMWAAYLTAIPVVLSYPITRTWWNFVKFDYFDAEFVEELDRVLLDTPVFDDLRPTIERALDASGR